MRLLFIILLGFLLASIQHEALQITKGCGPVINY